MKILLLDIETAPNLGYVWQLWQQNLGVKQIVHGTYLLCWAAKWYGEKEIMFDSLHQSSKTKMVKGIHKLLDEADVVVHYYGSKFDVPMLNNEFVSLGLAPPAPYKQVDLKKVASDQFRFPSNKLEYVAKALGIGQKADVGANTFELWIACMNGDAKAWKKMEIYNIQDVRLLERLYDKFKPWIRNHPIHGTYSGDLVCPNCGSKHYQSRGKAHTKHLIYDRFQCTDCKTWFRSTSSINKIRDKKRHVGI